MQKIELPLYSNMENLVLRARSETEGSASEFSIRSIGVMEYWSIEKIISGCEVFQ